ncbi:Txe/YoeB family addiction module toxin [Dyadobacter chenwenxiniae]|uniref:Putative mRNA interferase YoeB n=1 Tax=Dyadobacter chenwenxiniae TaxID=2906456 RepID=A0A9X1PSF1_9BACT|nr:Txe/YoeB family addiction module toxin [Dyadobacter chenwenxiniae]MCF0065249.1 Txe/YoeB family addiction module toxin [Dyadobacter chenwenxiniae]UON84481.1 Txe/YoeB family addiction module toxin [Dyadobacter chenwenxiniae]
MRRIIFDTLAIEDLTQWSKTEPRLVKKVFELITDIQKHPFEGIGKPEGLKHQFKGCWSRRITDEHRLIYKVVSDGDIFVMSVHGHYDQ